MAGEGGLGGLGGQVPGHRSRNGSLAPLIIARGANKLHAAEHLERPKLRAGPDELVATHD